MNEKGNGCGSSKNSAIYIEKRAKNKEKCTWVWEKEYY
jgi:hypothetical protein